MSDHSTAPWTPEQVNSLNDYQHCEFMHPFTCGKDRGDEEHTKYAQKHNEDAGTLIATSVGWLCPICGYYQNWAFVHRIIYLVC